MAIAGPDYECIYVDIGSNRQMNDSGVWNSSDLRRKVEGNCLSIPVLTPLPLEYIRIPYLFVGGDAFVVNSYMMKSPNTRKTRLQLPSWPSEKNVRESFWYCS